MSGSAAPSRPKRRARISVALIAVAILGLLELAFLAYAAIYKLSHEIMLVESAIILVVSLVFIYLVLREDRRNEEAGAIAERQLSHLADFATDLYWETDLEGVVITAGGRMMKTITPDVNRIVGRHYLDVIKLDEAEMQKMLSALSEVRPYSDILSVFKGPDNERFYISLSGTPRYDRSGNIVGYLGVGTNVTRRIETQGRLKHMAEHDMLTGLANRYAFQNRIEREMAKSAEDENVALLTIDLDNFKTINDTFGHQTGDALLNMVGKRIKKTIRGSDWAARLGGDEFVVVSQNVTNPMDACLVAARIISALARPYRIGGLELNATASVGIACAPLHAGDTKSLMKFADLALYEAKNEGRNCYRLFQAQAGSSDLYN
ncbi:MAG: sensor domain-containing diguanylate cyclase [Pseudomonadota bacterium]